MFLFSVIHNSNTSALELNSNMAKINRLAFQWNMIFNPNPKNISTGIHFQSEIKSNIASPTPKLHFPKTSWYLIILNTRLFFEKHLETVLCKIKLQVLSVSCRISYPGQFWSHSVKHLFVPTLIIAIFMIKPTMHCLTRN